MDFTLSRKLIILGSASLAVPFGILLTVKAAGGPKKLMRKVARWWLSTEEVEVVRKQTLVEATDDGRLPVYTITLALQDGKTRVGARLEFGDVLKVLVPGVQPRSYSMSGERDGSFDITYKVYPNGRGSGYLDSLKIGSTMQLFYLTPRRRSSGTYVGLIAFGVGITEVLPVAAAELSKHDASSVIIIWASRCAAETFWGTEMEELKERHGKRFELVRVYSREKAADGSALYGRVSSKLLKQIFDERWGAAQSKARFLTVGTKEMIRAANGMLAEIGYPMHKHNLLPRQSLLRCFRLLPDTRC